MGATGGAALSAGIGDNAWRGPNMHPVEKLRGDDGARPSDTVHWYSLADAPAPEWLSASACIAHANSVTAPINAPAIFLAPVASERIVADTKALREKLGELACLIVIPQTVLSEAWAARVLDCGADDVLLSHSRSAFEVCLARAKNVLRQRQRALAEQATVVMERDFLQACIDNLPSPIFFKNSNFVYVGCNNAFAEYIGMPVEQIIGRRVRDIAPEAYAVAYTAADELLLRDGGTQVYDGKVRLGDGSMRDVSHHKAAITDAGGKIRGIAGCMLDITERKRLEAKLIDAAERDPLTNAYNRRKFFAFAESIENQAMKTGMPVSLAVIDIDHFKTFNDRWGHAEGDRILCDVARLLEEAIGKENFLARAGGEEFFAVFPDVKGAVAMEIAETCRCILAEAQLGIERGAHAPSISIGVAEWQIATEALWDAVKRADGALYDAKLNGRNRVSFAG